MVERYVFADESGNFDFSLKTGASRYFVLTTVTTADPGALHDLVDLRRHLAWRGLGVQGPLHATDDEQTVRDEVFAVISGLDIRADSLIVEKRKAKPHLQDEQPLYKLAWYLHFKYVAPRVVSPDDQLLVLAASIGTRRKRKTMRAALDDVVSQVAPCAEHQVAWWPAESDPGLWVADYICWAVQRKWELGDMRSYDLISHLLKSEKDIFAIGKTFYY